MIPQELRDRPQWALWGVRDEPNPKRPYKPYPRIPANVTDRATWGEWATAAEAIKAGKAKGAGYMLDGDYTVIDLDSVIDRRGHMWPGAARIVQAVGGYVEVSQSGRGLHIVARGNLDGVALRNRAHLPMSRADLQRYARPGHVPGIEVYDRARFIALTGDVLDASHADICDGGGRLIEAVAGYLTPTESTTMPRTHVNAPQSDANGEPDKLLGLMLKGAQGAKIARLWDGDTSGYGSQSEADAALVRYLAFYADLDRARIDEAFRRSGLYRAKWDERRGGKTYGEATIDRVVGAWQGDTLRTYMARKP